MGYQTSGFSLLWTITPPPQHPFYPPPPKCQTSPPPPMSPPILSPHPCCVEMGCGLDPSV